jgi:hypothetical protein
VQIIVNEIIIVIFEEEKLVPKVAVTKFSRQVMKSIPTSLEKSL